MRAASVPLLAWGALLLLLGAGLAIWSGSAASLLLFAGALPVLLFACWQLVRPDPDRTRLLPRISFPIVILALGVTAGAIGLTAGLWLSLIGAELFLFGLAWLWRERRAERRLGE